MDLDFLITELDETTIQIDKMRYLATQISTKACEKTKHAKNALQYDFESQEIVKCAAILSDYIEVADAAIKRQSQNWQNTIQNFRKEMPRRFLLILPRWILE